MDDLPAAPAGGRAGRPQPRPKGTWWHWTVVSGLAGVAGAVAFSTVHLARTAEGMEALAVPVMVAMAALAVGAWLLAQLLLVPRRHHLTLLPVLVAVVCGAVVVAPEVADDIRRDHEREQWRAERERRAATDERDHEAAEGREVLRGLSGAAAELEGRLARLWDHHRDDLDADAGPWDLVAPAGLDTPVAVAAVEQRHGHPVPVALFDSSGNGTVDRVQVGEPPHVRCMTAGVRDGRDGTITPYVAGPLTDERCPGRPVAG